MSAKKEKKKTFHYNKPGQQYYSKIESEVIWGKKIIIIITIDIWDGARWYLYEKRESANPQCHMREMRNGKKKFQLKVFVLP